MDHTTRADFHMNGRQLMTSDRQKIHVLVAIPMLIAMVGCAPTKPPLDELDAASRGLGAAKAAGAPTYAATEYRSAGVHFDQAQAAEAQEDYAAAARLARESAADSELAVAKSRVAKAREAIDRLRQDNANLERYLSEHAAPGEQP